MTDSLRLMTANLLSGKAHPDHLVEVLDLVKPDVLIAQEMAANAAEVIAGRFPHHDLRPDAVYRGRGVASMLTADFGNLSIPHRGGTWARVELGGADIWIAGVHMLNPVDFPWWRSTRRRTDQLEALFSWTDRVAAMGPVVVAGDMNASPRWPLYKTLAGRFVDLVAEASIVKAPAPTWAPLPALPRILRIDHVFGSGIEAIRSSTVSIKGSDHSAVVVDLIRRDDKG